MSCILCFLPSSWQHHAHRWWTGPHILVEAQLVLRQGHVELLVGDADEFARRLHPLREMGRLHIDNEEVEVNVLLPGDLLQPVGVPSGLFVVAETEKLVVELRPVAGRLEIHDSRTTLDLGDHVRPAFALHAVTLPEHRRFNHLVGGDHLKQRLYGSAGTLHTRPFIFIKDDLADVSLAEVLPDELAFLGASVARWSDSVVTAALKSEAVDERAEFHLAGWLPLLALLPLVVRGTHGECVEAVFA